MFSFYFVLFVQLVCLHLYLIDFLQLHHIHNEMNQQTHETNHKLSLCSSRADFTTEVDAIM